MTLQTVIIDISIIFETIDYYTINKETYFNLLTELTKNQWGEILWQRKIKLQKPF